MNQKTIPDNQDESFSMKHNVTLNKKNTKDMVPYFNLGEYYKERLINKIDLNSLSSKEKIRWDNYYTNDLIKNNGENKYHIRNSITKTSNSNRYKLIDSSLFNDLIYGLYTDENHIKYLEEVSGLKIKTNKEERNEYSVNYYGPGQYIPVHVDTHDLVVLITLKKDSEGNSTYYIDETHEDISDLLPRSIEINKSILVLSRFLTFASTFAKLYPSDEYNCFIISISLVKKDSTKDCFSFNLMSFFISFS